MSESPYEHFEASTGGGEVVHVVATTEAAAMLGRRDREEDTAGIWSDAKAAVAAWKEVGEKIAKEVDRFSGLFDKYLPHVAAMGECKQFNGNPDKKNGPFWTRIYNIWRAIVKWFCNLKLRLYRVCKCEAVAPADPRFMAILQGLETKCAGDADPETRRHARKVKRLRECCEKHPRIAARVQHRFVSEWEDECGETADTSSPEWWERFKKFMDDHQQLIKLIQIIISLLSLFVMFI